MGGWPVGLVRNKRHGTPAPRPPRPGLGHIFTLPQGGTRVKKRLAGSGGASKESVPFGSSTFLLPPSLHSKWFSQCLCPRTSWLPSRPLE